MKKLGTSGIVLALTLGVFSFAANLNEQSNVFLSKNSTELKNDSLKNFSSVSSITPATNFARKDIAHIMRAANRLGLNEKNNESMSENVNAESFDP